MSLFPFHLQKVEHLVVCISFLDRLKKEFQNPQSSTQNIQVDLTAGTAGDSVSSFIEAAAQHGLLLALVAKDAASRREARAFLLPELDVLDADCHELDNQRVEG